VRAQERILGRDQGTEDALGRSIPARQVVLDEGHKPAPPNGNALGHFVPVENEGALAHFHAALDALATTPEKKNKVRILAYGASHTQAGIYSSYLRFYLQSRFGNGGPGFIPVGMERGWSYNDFRVRSHGLEVEYVQAKAPLEVPRAPSTGRARRHFGLSGSAALAGPNSWVKVTPSNESDPDLTASQYGLFYATEPDGSEISVRVDGGPPVRLSTRASSVEARYHTFDRPLGWHDVEVRSLGPGQARLFGLSVERMGPGLVLDTLGIRGTRAASMLLWDQRLWTEHMQRRAPDLVLLAYGTNETTDRGQPIEDYTADLARVLGRVREALPEASCVLVGPGDFPKSEQGNWVTRPRLLEIISAQRHLAPQFGCGFWDAYTFMGGEGAMDQWVRANPRVGAPDHIHLTPRGYVRMGLMLGDALMRAYDAQHIQSGDRIAVQRGSDPSAAGASAAAGAGSSSL
ncbi:MAG TPA: GDSL-type esterase/lipase family protein, partial [Polyangiaceae bacterium]|nr:GDSL-type esterase/lipase family protein [Polyangiaceae bacterium]